MARTGSRNFDVDQLRLRLLEVASKQIELRRRLTEYLETSGVTITETARLAAASRPSLQDFQKGLTSLGSGRGLVGLCKLLDCEDLGNEIADLALKIGDRYLGLAVRSPAVITTATNVLKAHQERSARFGYAEFAEAFGEYASIILGVLNSGQAGLTALEDNDVRETVEIMLIDDLDDKLEVVWQRHNAIKETASRRLEELVRALWPHFGGKGALARTLNINASTMYDAMAGRASLQTIESMIAKAEKCAGNLVPTSTLVELAPPEEVANPPTPPSILSSIDGSAAVGGVTTEEGVQFVLTVASFQQLRLEEGVREALRDFLLQVLPAARLALNIGSQIGDHSERKTFQRDIGPELQELQMAIEQFTFAHPNRLLELHESQRQVWAVQGKNTQTKKGTKK